MAPRRRVDVVFGSRVVLVAVVLATIMAGCAAPPADRNVSLGDDTVEGLFIRGIVIDPELVPIPDAHVASGDLVAQTDTLGEFRLGPIEPGDHVLVAEKGGYASASIEILVGTEAPPRIVLQLTPIAQDVPYFEIQSYPAIIGCAVATPTGRVTCGLVAQLSGANPIADSSVFPFTIPQSDLAMLLVETMWQPGTAFAQQLSVNVLDQAGDQSNCVTTACYAEQVGASPVRIAFIPGERWQDADPYHAFPGDEGHGFNVYLMPPFGTAETPFLLYLDQRADTFLTFFYNREGSPDFTALPDA